MKKLKLVSKIIIGLFAITLMACNDSSSDGSRVETLPFYGDASFTPHWIDANSPELQDFHQIPDFNLLNQDGVVTTAATFENKIYVTDFFFTACPGICPKMTKNMGILHDKFLKDDEVMLLSHSVTPDRDSISVLKEYADERAIDSNKWHLVTGDRAEIYTLGRQQYFIEEDMGLESSMDEFLHTENFVLVDQNRHIRGIYNGLNLTSIDQLIADIKTLKKEGEKI